jgi:hypothetical protein
MVTIVNGLKTLGEVPLGRITEDSYDNPTFVRIQGGITCIIYLG